MTEEAVAGDAPKDFIRVYEYGIGRRAKPKSWPAFIAKVGHKWYPAESATEQLMTRVGECLGIRVAESQLMEAEGQIRFLSRYFLGPDEILVHGAQIVASYLEDETFVKNVGEERAESEIFTFQVLRTALDTRFAKDKAEILADLVRMIAFDALVGNQDRHLYNWGVIVHAKGTRRPRFSPIYDTARGLFWNVAEDALARYETPASLKKYIRGSHPVIGWDAEPKLDHFDLVRLVADSDSELRSVLLAIDYEGALKTFGTVVDQEFDQLLSDKRRELVMRCLQERFRLFGEARGGAND